MNLGDYIFHKEG